MPAIEQRHIATLLDTTQAAHNEHEQRDLHGVYDQQWAAWYAAYLVEHGIGDVLGQTITIEQLARLLTQYDQDYHAHQRQESWLDYYAAQLLAWRAAVSA